MYVSRVCKELKQQMLAAASLLSVHMVGVYVFDILTAMVLQLLRLVVGTGTTQTARSLQQLHDPSMELTGAELPEQTQSL